MDSINRNRLMWSYSKISVRTNEVKDCVWNTRRYLKHYKLETQWLQFLAVQYACRFSQANRFLDSNDEFRFKSAFFKKSNPTLILKFNSNAYQKLRLFQINGTLYQDQTSLECVSHTRYCCAWKKNDWIQYPIHVRERYNKIRSIITKRTQKKKKKKQNGKENRENYLHCYIKSAMTPNSTNLHFNASNN